MITSGFIDTYRETLGAFMLNYVLGLPWSLFDIDSFVTFWLPCVLFFSLIVLGLFRRRTHLLSLRRCVILLGSTCALWGFHFASGVFYIFTRMEPGHYDDCMTWGIGVGRMIRGCILLILAAVLVCQNLLFAKESTEPVPLAGPPESPKTP